MTILVALIVGVVAGIIISCVVIMKLMTTKMMVERKSSKSFEATCRTIEEVVETFNNEGWGQPIDKWHFFKTMEKKNAVPKGIANKMIYFICNADYAKQVIEGDRKMSAMMPCSWSVYETDKGEVYISKMNIGLMAMMFSGVIKETMMKVEEADKAMLAKIL